jgi:hypothetical protein
LTHWDCAVSWERKTGGSKEAPRPKLQNFRNSRFVKCLKGATLFFILQFNPKTPGKIFLTVGPKKFYQCLAFSSSEVDLFEEFSKIIPRETRKTENSISSTPAS